MGISLQVAPAEFSQEETLRTFMSIQICPFHHKAIFYLKDHVFLKEGSVSGGSQNQDNC